MFGNSGLWKNQHQRERSFAFPEVSAGRGQGRHRLEFEKSSAQ